MIWRKVSTPCNSTPINCGQILTGTISAADQINFYTFTAAANDVVMIRTRKTSGNLTPYFELYNPSGTRIWGPGWPATTQTLTVAGTYKILVVDRYNVSTGDYLLLHGEDEGTVQRDGQFDLRSGHFGFHRDGCRSSGLESLYVYGSGGRCGFDPDADCYRVSLYGLIRSERDPSIKWLNDRPSADSSGVIYAFRERRE